MSLFGNDNGDDEEDSSEYDYEGIVDFYNETGRYGFVDSESFEADVFFYNDNLDVELEEGVEIEFNAGQDDKGPTVTEATIPSEDDKEEESAGPYGFLATDEPETEEADDEPEDPEPPLRVRKWSLGSHSTAGETEAAEIQSVLDGLDDDVDSDLANALEEAAGMVSTASVSNFECPICGLNHGHSDTKHDIRDEFDIDPAFADEMQFNPYCHCGVNELAMLLDFFGDIGVVVFLGGRHDSLRDFQNETLQEILRQRDEIDPLYSVPSGFDDDPQQDAMESAVREAGLGKVDTTTIADLVDFYDVYTDVRGAADSAPVPGHVRQTLSEYRETLEQRSQ